ncbi:MAG: HvfA family oxazolone/thioamide-modified RiPP metallophore [Burkholderiales bacterium]
MNSKKTRLTLALGSAFAVSFAAAPVASAAGNPFGMQPLKSGYLLADAKMQDGKCGGKKTDTKAKEAKCGGSMEKDAAAGKMQDGKCGEGKCGSMKAKDAKRGGNMGGKAAPAGKQ